MTTITIVLLGPGLKNIFKSYLKKNDFIYRIVSIVVPFGSKAVILRYVTLVNVLLPSGITIVTVIEARKKETFSRKSLILIYKTYDKHIVHQPNHPHSYIEMYLTVDYLYMFHYVNMDLTRTN